MPEKPIKSSSSIFIELNCPRCALYFDVEAEWNNVLKEHYPPKHIDCPNCGQEINSQGSNGCDE